MGVCSSTRGGDDGPSVFDHHQNEQRPLAFAHVHDKEESMERERLLDEDERMTEERVNQYGLGVAVHELLTRERAKMLMLQIIMKFQESLIVRRRLTKAVWERWRYVVVCHKAGVDAGSWAPPRASIARREVMKIQAADCEGYVIEKEAQGNPKSAKSRGRMPNPDKIARAEMDHLVMMKENDLMRTLEIHRQAAEAKGEDFNIKNYLAKGRHERICCKNSSCVVS